jgi:hypothetical protein
MFDRVPPGMPSLREFSDDRRHSSRENKLYFYYNICYYYLLRDIINSRCESQRSS